MRKYLYAAPFLALLAACEDAGNEGDDSLLTGGSIVVVLIVILVVVYLFTRNKR